LPRSPESAPKTKSVRAKTGFNSVDEYIASKPEAVQRVLRQLRGVIREAVPAAQELIAYNMPAYTLNNTRLLHFAIWKQHYSIYAATKQLVASFHDELALYKVDKGTIQLPLSEPVPAELIGRIAKFRAQQVASPQDAKLTAAKIRQAR
jgi:uncharacterized protein YdhG (YjbR/CyaY superfamily)